MTDFLSNVVAAFLGFVLAILCLAYASADPMVKIGCDIQESNPFAETACVISTTLSS